MLYALPLTSDAIFMLIFAAILVGLVVFLAVSVRRSKKNAPATEEADFETAEEADEAFEDDLNGDDDGEVGDETDEETADEGWTPPEPEAYPARVADMRVVIGNVGGNKRPKTDASFLVTFLTDDGTRTEYPVPEELYVTLEVDQTGTLVLLNGGFFDFGSGEEYDPAAAEAFEETFGSSEGNE